MEIQTLQSFVNEYQTPAYIFDLDMLTERVRMIKEILGERVEICYAMKANPFLIGPLKGVADRYEVCSPGEFHICEETGIPMEQIVLSGVNKEKRDISHAMHTYGAAGIYTIESRQHLELLEQCAGEEQICIHAIVRVTSGNQFGVDEEDVLRIFHESEKYPHVKLVGIQCYSGTQKKKLSKIEKELTWLDSLCEQIERECQCELQKLEYGPGFYVPYFESDEEIDDQALLREFSDVLKKLRFKGMFTLEMGRYIAAYCGYYATKIVDQKINKGQNYAIVDGGINHLNYFGQAMAMKIPHYQHFHTAEASGQKDGAAAEALWNICGSLCTVNDVLVKQLPLKEAGVGDALVFERVGAYSVTEGIYLFLSRTMPEIYFWSNAAGVQKVRGEIESYRINSCDLI